MDATETKTGWGRPGTGKKWHYFNDAFSLCNKWGFYYGPLEQGNDSHADNCKECSRKKLALDAKKVS